MTNITELIILAVDESLADLADNITNIMTQIEMENIDNHDLLQKIMNSNSLAAVKLDSILYDARQSLIEDITSAFSAEYY